MTDEFDNLGSYFGEDGEKFYRSIAGKKEEGEEEPVFGPESRSLVQEMLNKNFPSGWDPNSDFETKALLNASETAERAHWNPDFTNPLNLDSWRGNVKNKLGYRGEAGSLNIKDVEDDVLFRTDAEYWPAEDVAPEEAAAHAYIAHAIGTLVENGASRDGSSIVVEDLSSGQAEEVVRAFTLLDYASASDQYDQDLLPEIGSTDLGSLDRDYRKQLELEGSLDFSDFDYLRE
jgi:hypothetical protein